jgi:hypothetical protein
MFDFANGVGQCQLLLTFIISPRFNKKLQTKKFSKIGNLSLI